MKNKKRVYEVLTCVTGLPKNIIQLHGLENMPEFLLHTMCQKTCFNLQKAAYFVDNPDFNFFKGVAGYYHPESYQQDHWNDPEIFTHHMKNAPFNKKVRDIQHESIKKNNQSEQQLVDHLSKELHFSAPHYLSWPVKYNNFGLLLFDSSDEDQESIEEHLHAGLHLLGFCPVF